MLLVVSVIPPGAESPYRGTKALFCNFGTQRANPSGLEVPVSPTGGVSRSIVSEIARLIKPFTLSPRASAWALIGSRFPLGMVRPNLKADSKTGTREKFPWSLFVTPS